MVNIFSKIRNRLTFWFLLIALIPVILIIGYSYHTQIRSLEEDTYTKLTAIRDLKTDRISNWLEERYGDLLLTASDYNITDLELVVNNGDYATEEQEIISRIRYILNSYKENFPDYREIYILHPETGTIMISTTKEHEGKSRFTSDIFQQPLKLKGLYMGEVHHSVEIDKATMGLSTPVFCRLHNGKHIVGILAVEINLDYSLLKILQNKTGLGTSGETLIVNSEGYVLNNLRWYEDAPLKLKINAEPAVRAAAGYSGLIEAEDYRGEPVWAAYSHIPAVNWGLVCKQDMREIERPLKEQLKDYLIILFISVLVIILVSVLLGRSISDPVVKLKTMAKEISEDNLSARTDVTRNDELGSLSNSINKMAESIVRKMKVQIGISAVSKAMIGHDKSEAFANQLLKTLMELSGAVMASFYHLDEKDNVYRILAAAGLNENLYRSISADKPEGEFDTAIKSGRIFIFDNISEDTKFIYKTFTGEMLPHQIITIPVLSGRKVIALISLASLHKFSEETMESINIAWHAINQSYDNLLKGEKTTQLANKLQKSNEELSAQSEELALQTKELQQQQEELKRNSLELNEQNHELEVQKEQVLSATRLKSEFLANMSHELRTPLNSVLNLSELLNEGLQDRLDPEELNYFTIIIRNGKKLLNLINDLLDLSKIEAGKIDILPSRFSIKTFFRDMKELAEPLAKDKGLDLIFDIEDSLSQIETDEKRLYQIMQNLIGNAIKFTTSGFVKITVYSYEGMLNVNVADSGMGIDKSKLNYIFEEFRQGDGSSTRSHEGTGLGLAITGKLVNILQGRISVSSELGRGSTFSISIPLHWTGNSELKSYDFTQPVEVDIAKEVIPAQKAKLLVVEDNESAVIQVRSLLLRNGFEVDVARNGREALQSVQREIPDGIILDLMMPEIDGFQVLEELRGTDETRHIPVLILTAKDLSRKDLDRLSANNVQQLVHKGDVNLKGLLQKINTMLFNRFREKEISYPVEIDKNEVTDNRKTILIIEDDTDSMITMRALLYKKYRIVEAVNGFEGLHKAVSVNPDLILMDINLPSMSGIELIMIFNETEETKDVPVIVVSAYMTEEMKNELDEAGCKNYLSKPVEVKHLLEMIKEQI